MKERSLLLGVTTRFKEFLLAGAVLGLLLLAAPPLASAHNMDIYDLLISGVGQDDAVSYDHADADPWKGWLNLTAKNTGTQPWGDFHFQIFGDSVSSVDWIVTGPSAPQSSQSGLTWSVDNDRAEGAILDLYFYGDPVTPGQTAAFSVYTDNTEEQLSFFGVQLWPTPVPIPGAVWLLVSALIGSLGLGGKLQK